MSRGRLLFVSGGLALAFVTISSSGGGEFRFSFSASSGWTLVWSDEFNGADGSLPDKTKWTYDIGGNGWGNHELEYYTDHPENARIQGGNLLITARKEKFTGAGGVTREYTSARLKTQNLFAQTYGRFAADFHLYAVEWEPAAIRLYVDSSLYATFTSDQWPSGQKWVFDHPFFVILNLAVGGDWPGPPDAATVFPQSMLV